MEWRNFMSNVNEQQIDNLVAMLDGYAEKGGHHLNVNVLTRETLLDAQAHPENYPQLTVRAFGPTLRGVHAPGERLDLASLDKFVALLVDVIQNYK